MVDKSLKEIFTAEFLSICGGLIAGTILTSAIGKIELLPAIFIFLPGFLEMRGAIGGSLAARLTSGLFVRALKPEIRKSKILYGNIIAAIVLTILVSASLGLMTAMASYLLDGTFSLRIIFVALSAGVISIVISIPLTVFAVFYFFKRGNDPNNIIGPYITSTGDVISTISLLASIMIF